MTRPTRVPDLLVEKLHLGDLTPAEADAVRARLAATEPDAGAARLAALRASDAADAPILARLGPLPAIHSGHPEQAGHPDRAERGNRADRALRRFNPAWLAIPVAVALALVVTLALPTSNPSELRAKGDSILLIQRRTPSGPTPVTATDRLAAGDAVQLQLRTAAPRHFAVLSIDGRGALTTHLAPTPTAMTSLDLAEAFTLDDAPGFERFAFFTSPHPLELTALEAALKELATGPDPAHDPIRVAPPIEVNDVLVGKALPR
jgi:hypothetical protein